MNINDIGKWPVDGEEARKTGEFIKITSEDGLRLVHGKANPVLLNFFASNDVASMGEMTIPSGGVGPRQSEVDSHAGDAVFYVKKGPITFFIPDTHEVYHVESDDFMFIPEGVRYQCINYTGNVVKSIFIVAPQL